MDCQSASYIGVLGLAAYSALEFWLGRTKRTKASSLVELLGVIIGFVIVKLITKGGKDGKGI